MRTIRIAIALLAIWMISAPARAQSGVLTGRVVSASSGEPVEFAQILVQEAHRSTTSDGNGAFLLRRMPAGQFTLKAFRIGFFPFETTITVATGDTLELTLRMRDSVIESAEVVVVDEGLGAQTVEAASELRGGRLRQQLGTTIAETLDQEPGLSMRSMGPAPARPVLRGLGGERLLVLEDGGRTGDLSATTSDHALVVDPITADRIEIVRGPAALIYGPNTLGGAVNVVRDYVPSSVPSKVRTTLSGQGQSASRGLAGGAVVVAPIGTSAVVRADGAYRAAGDVATPDGRLGNTALDTGTASLGASLVRSWGYLGVSGSLYDSHYGIPGGFVGAHPEGVSIELNRRHFRTRGEWITPIRGIRHLEAKGSYSRYFHQEFESNGSVGIEFGLLSYHATAIAHTAGRGRLTDGAVGFWVEHRDYASGGFSSTPATTEWSVAGFGHQTVDLGGTSLEVGARYDLRQVTPSREFMSDIGLIAQKKFGGVSASAALKWPLNPRLTLAASGMRSIRLPGIEELFSEGPHLAAYSFEVGNPDLGVESGTGFELSSRWEGPRVSWYAAAYLNRFSGYIFPRNTGELNTRIYLPIFQYAGSDARMEGAEGSVDIRLSNIWSVSSNLSFVRGTLTELDEPIPWTPPFRQSLSVRYDRSPLTVGATLRGSARQERLGEFEEPTSGYLVPDLFLEYLFSSRTSLHSLTLAIDNVSNTEYRDHLSRVKSVMPEPGRNVRLVYRVYL
ncbi:MAG: TonB-dependent receptor [Rhodothermales bacterium]|nr:TonB-dependent receptor [Rhodothermales bacterium]MBO6780340.1 TonB-dependent receptor [Rhodothermales bacterium]